MGEIIDLPPRPPESPRSRPAEGPEAEGPEAEGPEAEAKDLYSTVKNLLADNLEDTGVIEELLPDVVGDDLYPAFAHHLTIARASLRTIVRMLRAVPAVQGG